MDYTITKEDRAASRPLDHSIYECKYHLVWIPKYRFKVMEGRIRYYVRDKLRQLCEWKKFEIIQGNVQPEHIHLGAVMK